MRFQFLGALGDCAANLEAMPASGGAGGASRIPAPRKAVSKAATATNATASPKPAVSASRAAYLCVKATTAEDLTSAVELEAALQHAGYNPSKTLLDRYWTSDTESVPYQEFHQILQVGRHCFGN